MERDVVAVLISHVGDFLISGTDAFIAYVSGGVGNEYGAKVFEGGEAIYSGMWVKKDSMELIRDETISDGTQTFTGATLSPTDYEGGFNLPQPYREVRNRWANL